MKLLAVINLITFFMGNVVYTPIEVAPDHGIYATTMYIAETEVYDMGTETIEDDEGLITLVDGADHAWEWYPEDYYIGDYVSTLMDDNGTPNYIYDDIILEIRATGFYR